MATKHVSDYASSPANNDSDDDGQGSVGSNYQEEEDIKPTDNSVAEILKKYSLSVYKKPKQENHCFTCSEDFPGAEALHSHLIQHVSLPSVVVDKLPSDDEDTPPSGDDNWSDEDEAPPPQASNTPQKIDISQILKKTGITLKKPTEPDKSADSALNKLSGLGFTIKKNITPIKKEPESEKTNNVMEKLGKLGGIKLKLKSDGNNSNSFKVINGLKDFNPSDDENEPRDDENDDSKEEGDMDDEQDKSGEQEGSAGDNDSEGDHEQSAPVSRKNSDSNDSVNVSAINQKLANSLKNLQGKAIVTKIEQKSPNKPGPARIKQDHTPSKVVQQVKPPGRPAVKQTPKRGLNLQPLIAETPTLQVKEPLTPTKPAATTERRESYSERRGSNPERRESQDRTMDAVVVKQEIETVDSQSSNVPIFPGHIKSERTSPPLNDASSTPVLARIKSEPDFPASSTTVSTQNHYQPLVSTTSTPLLPVTKKEDVGMTIIEINGDSNDEDDDCCVVSATPAPEAKPKIELIPKTENTPGSYPPPSYSTSQSSFSSTTSTPTSLLSNRLAQTTEKQHNFNWNAPDSKPPLDMLEKSADEIFESLLSNSTKKENLSMSDANEYISLDTLGPQHSCDVCNTRFTDVSLLEEHRRMTGHSNSVIPVSSSTLLPYTPASNLLSSLIPVKQIADQVGKLSTITGSSAGFTHQQNVMINIQAYPGAGGVMMPPPQGYSSYPPGQNLPPDFSHSQNNMYGTGQSMPGQYPGQNYMGQHAYGQYQSPMPKPGYPGSMPQNQFSPSSSPYSTASPLQGMQQAVYGQAPTSALNTQIGQMGPPGPPPYVQASSPGGSMKPPTSSGLKIQNVQTFPPGQTLGTMMPGQNVGGLEMGGQPSASGQVVGQMQPPNPIRMAAGANITGIRPRMATPRGIRPTIRPGIQVHSQVRGQKPGVRMPMKRPAGMPGGPGQKRRTDMLLPGKHDNEDCHVMAMQRQREGLPMIQSVQGAKDKLNLGSQISITKKTVNKEANAMANVLASRGISIKQKQKSRSPTPERPVPHIPNLGAGMSIKHTSKSSNFSIPEAKVGGGMLSCKICKKMFMNQSSLSIHMSNAHPQSKLPVFKCDECPASYPKSLQLQHHKRVFHNVTGPNRELGLPVVDLSQEDNLKRLSHLGIYSFIPLANREQGNGCFGIPVISVHNMQNGLTSSLQALGADGLLSLGPLKPLPSA